MTNSSNLGALMKTKLISLHCFLLLTSVGCAAPAFQVTFRIVDEFDRPMDRVSVGVATFERAEMKFGEGTGEDIYKNMDGFTDTNGIVSFAATSPRSYVRYVVRPKDGYYSNGGGNAYSFKNAVGDRWQPWNPNIEVVLRPILNPVPMYAKRTGNLVIPEIGKSFGYDLAIGDWVVPFGKGVKSDLIFHLDREPDRIVKTADYYKRDVKLFDATLTVSFSDLNDGIQAIPVNPQWAGSEFNTPRSAPEDAYEPQFTKRLYRETAEMPIVETPKGGLGYFYRVRTQKQDGKIVNALYGKISDINLDVINSKTAIISFTYYLNPEANSRNMEFNPRQNVFKNLKESEKVSTP